MTEEKDTIEHLQQKLADLQKRQEQFQWEINRIGEEISRMRLKPDFTAEEVRNIPPGPETAKIAASDVKDEANESPACHGENSREAIPVAREPEKSERLIKSDLERFIGENLINKIGIAVTVIGVGIGAKYAIDHRLISPLARIIMGYLVGFGLLFFAIWLKKQYENFSAVLLSGSMAIMYFITFAAYSFYGFYPQMVAFILMVVFTAFTVMAALRYNREIIAVIGMVGAFAVPFLLSEGSHNVIVFFSYITIINSGILFIAFKKYWKPLYISAFLFTWLIFFTWFIRSYKPENDFTIALIFLFVFFVIFYLTFLAYKLVRKEKFSIFDILLLLSNSFIFYGMGYYILHGHKTGVNELGLFTVGNAIVHFIVSAAIYRNKVADRNLFYFVSGLVVVFLTIAVPVQLNGNWVTLLWICEAAILFAIGRTRNAPVYENISYPLILISFLSLLQDWGKVKESIGYTEKLTEFTPVLNIQFFSSLIFIAAFAVIIVFFFSRKYPSKSADKFPVLDLLPLVLPSLFIIVIFLSSWNELSAYYYYLFESTQTAVTHYNIHSVSKAGIDIYYFKKIWLCNYSLFFFALLSLINTLKIKSRYLGIAAFWLSLLTLLIFLFQSLYILSELRESYINRSPADYLPVTGFNIAIRYISFTFITLALVSLKLMISKNPPEDLYKIIFSLFFHMAVLWILCSEMLNIMDLLRNTHSYKFGLSILSGIYALMLIALGISGKKRYLRIAAIALLGVTLAKLFFYDISRLDTILKTILFLALGTLLLFVSFLYNKYKVRLFGDTESET